MDLYIKIKNNENTLVKRILVIMMDQLCGDKCKINLISEMIDY